MMFSVDSNGIVRIVDALSRPEGWEDISVELLDTICDYLPERNHLLRMTKVSKHWNTVVKSVLERRALQQWTVWQPFAYQIDLTLPISRLNIGTRQHYVPSRFEYQHHSSLFEDVAINPFPSNSLNLDAYPPEERFPLQNNLLEYTVLGFLSNHGAHLTSLTLGMVEVAPPKFYRILQQLPNLKAFTLHLSKDSNQSGHLREDEKLWPSPCPSLEYLKIRGILSDYGEPAQYMWLLKLFASQLISLEVDGIDFCQFNLAFQKLQRLKVIDPPRENFITAVSNFRAPLQMLSLHQYYLYLFSTTEFLRFLQYFSGSLVYLCVELREFEDDVAEVMKFPLTSELCPAFPKVTTLAVAFFDRNEVQNLVCKHLQPRLINLWTLQLFSFYFLVGNDAPEEERRKEAADFCKNAALWAQFPNLKTIEIYRFENDLNQVLSFVLTRGE